MTDQRQVFTNSLRTSPLRGIVLDDAGLTEVFARRELRTSWDQVGAVLWGADHVMIGLPERNLRIDASFGPWQRIGQLVEQRLRGGPLAPAGPRQVSAEQIEEWLDVPPGGAISFRTGTGLCALWIAIGLGWLYALFWPWADHGPWIVTMAVGSCLGLKSLLEPTYVTVSGEGVTLRRLLHTHYCSWSEVEVARGRRGVPQLVTPAGRITVDTTTGPWSYVLRTVEQIQSARWQGAILPHAQPLEEGALSLASRRSAGSDDGDRGISRSEP